MKRFIRKYKKFIFIFLIFIIIWNSMKPIKEAFEDPAYKQNNDNMRHGKHNFRMLPKTNPNGELNTDVGGDPSDGSKYHANLSPEQMIKNIKAGMGWNGDGGRAKVHTDPRTGKLGQPFEGDNFGRDANSPTVGEMLNNLEIMKGSPLYRGPGRLDRITTGDITN